MFCVLLVQGFGFGRLWAIEYFGGFPGADFYGSVGCVLSSLCPLSAVGNVWFVYCLCLGGFDVWGHLISSCFVRLVGE